jgi:hypothetical protein
MEELGRIYKPFLNRKEVKRVEMQSEGLQYLLKLFASFLTPLDGNISCSIHDAFAQGTHLHGRVVELITKHGSQ